MADGVLQVGGRVMATRLRLHPALLCAVLGAALSFGVGAALPIWMVCGDCSWGGSTVGGFGRMCVISSGPLWEVAAGVASYVEEIREMPPWQWWLHNGGVAAGVLAAGAVAGLVCWSAWERLRPARRTPTLGADPAGR
jgi:hypothetical protein